MPPNAAQYLQQGNKVPCGDIMRGASDLRLPPGVKLPEGIQLPPGIQMPQGDQSDSE